jgi:hypothetical protein
VLAGPVLSLGLSLRVRNGRLELISHQSHHYMPPPRYLIRTIRRTVYELGVEIDDRRMACLRLTSEIPGSGAPDRCSRLSVTRGSYSVNSTYHLVNRCPAAEVWVTMCGSRRTRPAVSRATDHRFVVRGRPPLVAPEGREPRPATPRSVR